MSKSKLCIRSAFFVLIVVSTQALNEGVFQPSSYKTLLDCCEESVITAADDVLSQCRNSESSSEDYSGAGWLDICEMQCYLNNTGAIKVDGTFHKEQLIFLLTEYLPDGETQTLLTTYIEDCLEEVKLVDNFLNSNEYCQPYYASLMYCIQGKIIVKCSETLDEAERCPDSQLCLQYCGIGGSSISYEYEDSESYSFESSDSSASDSDYDYETETMGQP